MFLSDVNYLLCTSSDFGRAHYIDSGISININDSFT